MTLNQLKYVIRIAETGSINKAAGQLFISQSVLSSSIHSLEKELGHDLFIRSPRGIRLTSFGQIFLSYVTPIEQQLRLLDGLLYENRSADINFSVVSNGFPFVSHICTSLYQKYADIGIHIQHYEHFGNEAMLTVANQQADIGVVRLWDCYRNMYEKQYESMKIEFHPIVSLNIVITIGPGNPLFHYEGNCVTVDMLSEYPLVMYEYMDSGPFGDIIERLRLKSSPSRIATSSRASIYEAIDFSDAYYLNSDYSRCHYNFMGVNMHYAPQRSLLLKDCSIKSIIGWIKRVDSPLSSIEQEAVGMLYEYLSPEP